MLCVYWFLVRKRVERPEICYLPNLYHFKSCCYQINLTFDFVVWHYRLCFDDFSHDVRKICWFLSLKLVRERHGKIQGQWALKKTKKLPCILPCFDNPIFMKSFVATCRTNKKFEIVKLCNRPQAQSHKIGNNNPLRFYVYCVAISEYIDFIKTISHAYSRVLSWAWMTTTTHLLYAKWSFFLQYEVTMWDLWVHFMHFMHMY